MLKFVWTLVRWYVLPAICAAVGNFLKDLARDLRHSGSPGYRESPKARRYRTHQLSSSRRRPRGRTPRRIAAGRSVEVLAAPYVNGLVKVR